jgi:hypothetical protein
VFSWVSPIFQFGMEHEREKQFVQTQHEIALRNAGRKGTDIQINGKSHIGHTASVAGIRTLAERSISWLAAGGDFIVPTTSAPQATPKLPRQKHLKCGCPGT